MNILIVGCGHLGAALANKFDKNGHDVSVVDDNPDSIQLLGEDFDGIFVSGVAMDMDILRDAGVESCDAVAVVTSDDNLNITVSQIVKKFFGVENVIARITDSSRENVFKKKFGLRTLCQTNLSANAMYAAIMGIGDNVTTSDDSTFIIDTIRIENEYVGRYVSELPLKKGAKLFGVKRSNGDRIICDSIEDFKIEEGDSALFISMGT